jgi:uncharacterized protein (DUF885 family)
MHKPTDLFVVFLCSTLAAATGGVPSAPATAADADSDDAQELHAIIDRQWQDELRDHPEWASRLGDRRYNDRWDDLSSAALQRQDERHRAVLAELARIHPDRLGPDDRLNLTLLRKNLQSDAETYQDGWRLLPLDQRWGIQTANVLADQLRFDTEKDYEDWIARLRRFGDYMDQTIALMREGMRVGKVHARVVMERVPHQIKDHLVDDPARSLFFKPLRAFPDAINQPTRDRLTAEAKDAIAKTVTPAFARFYDFFTKEYLPACTEKPGIWQWPDGKALYARRARYFTTTDLTPDEIHHIGLREVKRIRGEMEAIIKQVGFEGTFAQFLEHLRTDKRFYYDNGDDLLTGYRALCKRIDPQLVKLFRTLPRTPYGVEPIPMNLAPDTTTAYYNPPAADGSRAGIYFVNLYRPDTRPKYEMAALSLHEGVPGHHLQIALAMEQSGLPQFRRHALYTAYVEGWALYCEGLGDELGLYKDPYAKFGALTYEIWRAIRLVVDTGIHDKHWTRKQAIDYFRGYAAKSELDITNEVDRYIAWPGQALAYKIGQLKIRELRDKATRELGDRFDIKAFHDAVLLSGALPLDVLDQKVNAWIERKKKAQP